MNLKKIDGAIASYDKDLADADKARLAFFRGIWGIQQTAEERVAAAAQAACGLATATAGYAVPDTADLDAWYWDDTTSIFAHAPVAIDAGELVRTAGEIAAYIAEQGSLTDEDAAALRAFDWGQLAGDKAAVSGAPSLALAGSDPADYLALAAKWLEDAQVAGADIVLMVLSLALRAMLEPAQAAAMSAEHKAALAGYTTHTKPLRCPCCGGEPTLAYVGPTEASSGNGRVLYCGQCGSTWEVERVRCPHCGSRSQNKLHYVSIEQDDAHRIYACDDCGRYLRTFFAPDMKGLGAPFVPEVEDVVMATLDAVAQSDDYAAALAKVQSASAKKSAMPAPSASH